MTREEAIKIFNTLLVFEKVDCTREEAKECINMAIKALEQEPKSEYQQDHEILKAYSDGANEALDKIGAEIEQVAFKDVNGSKFIFVNRVNQIIDKYKAECQAE